MQHLVGCRVLSVGRMGLGNLWQAPCYLDQLRTKSGTAENRIFRTSCSILLSVPPAVHAYLQPMSDLRHKARRRSTLPVEMRGCSHPAPPQGKWASPLGSRHVPPRARRPECQSVNKGCPSARYRNHRPGDARFRSFFDIFWCSFCGIPFLALTPTSGAVTASGLVMGCVKIRYPSCSQITPQHHGFWWLSSHAVGGRLCLCTSPVPCSLLILSSILVLFVPSPLQTEHYS